MRLLVQLVLKFVHGNVQFSGKQQDEKYKIYRYINIPLSNWSVQVCLQTVQDVTENTTTVVLKCSAIINIMICLL